MCLQIIKLVACSLCFTHLLSISSGNTAQKDDQEAQASSPAQLLTRREAFEMLSQGITEQSKYIEAPLNISPDGTMEEGPLDNIQRLIPSSYVELVNALYRGTNGFFKGHTMASLNHLNFRSFTPQLKDSILAQCAPQTTIEGLLEERNRIWKLTKHLR